MIEVTITFVDPPTGWAHGFPKPFTFRHDPTLSHEEQNKAFDKWFRDNGYPQKLIDKEMLSYCRYFTKTFLVDLT